jgi:hypothetical protein
MRILYIRERERERERERAGTMPSQANFINIIQNLEGGMRKICFL